MRRLTLLRRLAFATIMFALLGVALAPVQVSYAQDPYGGDDESDDAVDQTQAVIRNCEGVDIAGTPTILFVNATEVFYGPSSSMITGIVLPAGTTYRLLSVVTLPALDENDVGETWYEIDGPCPAGTGQTLWFPQGTAFMVVAANL